MAEKKCRQTAQPRLSIGSRADEIGDLRRVCVAGKEIEPVERLQALPDPAAGHVETADREVMARQMFSEPGKESPILETLPSVRDHDQRARRLRDVQVSPNRKVFDRWNREIRH